MMDSVAYWVGISTLAIISGLGSLVVFLLMIAVVDILGQHLWNKLKRKINS